MFDWTSKWDAWVRDGTTWPAASPWMFASGQGGPSHAAFRGATLVRQGVSWAMSDETALWLHNFEQLKFFVEVARQFSGCT